MKPHALLLALLRRETALAWLVTLVAAVLAAAGAARMAPGLVESAGPDLTGRFIRRFDLTALGLCTLLAAVRIAQRVAADHEAGWLVPYMAAGGRRWSYSVALTAAIALATSSWFIAAAITFAVGVRITAGSTELLALLPPLLGGGLLLILSFTLFTGMFVQVTREAVSALMVAGTVLAIPYVLVMVWLQGTGNVPDALRWLVRLAPKPFPPGTWPEAAGRAAFVCGAGAIVAALSSRFAGRRT